MSEKIPDFQLIGKIEVSPTADLIFKISQYRGHYYANIRKFLHTERYNGPTKSGLALRSDLLDWLIDQLKNIKRTVPSFQEVEIGKKKKREGVDLAIHTTLSKRDNNILQLDIREYMEGEKYSGPTKKGFRFNVDKLSQVIKYLELLAKKMGEMERAQPGLFKNDSKLKEEEEREKKENDIDLAVSEVFPEGPRRFPDSFFDQKIEFFIEINISSASIRLGQLLGNKQQIISNSGIIYEARNLVEGKYILYAHLSGNNLIRIPKNTFEVFRIVKMYEIYLRDAKKCLIESYYNRTGHKQTAEHFAEASFKKLGLPWLDEKV